MEADDRGIVGIWLVEPSGAGRRLSADDLNTPAPQKGYLWIHLDKDHAFVDRWLHENAELNQDIVDILLAPDSRPRALIQGDSVLVNLRGVNLNPDSDEEDMVGIRLWVTGNRIISVRKRRMFAIQDLGQQIEDGRGPQTTGAFVAKLALLIADRMGPTVTKLNDTVDDLEEQVLEGNLSELKSDVAEIRRKTILLRRYVAPQKDALISLSFDPVPWITDKDILRLREAADHATRITEELDAARERAAIVYDQLVDIRAEKMNNLMFVLSIVSAIFLPLGLVAGMLGMNVGGVPGMDSPAAFWWVTGGLAVSGLLLAGLFKFFKWI